MSYEHTKIHHSDWFESGLLCVFWFFFCLVTGE